LTGNNLVLPMFSFARHELYSTCAAIPVGYAEMPHDRRVNDSFAPPKHLVKTKLCKHFTKGYCRYQDQCAFAHETDELVYRPDLTKTKMCSRFLVEGGCSNNCSFAHSWEELRHVDRRGSAAASAHLAAMVSIDRAVESPIALGSRDELGSHAPEPLPLPDMPNPPLHWLGEKVPPQRWLPLEEPGAICQQQVSPETSGNFPSSQRMHAVGNAAERWAVLADRVLAWKRQSMLRRGRFLIATDPHHITSKSQAEALASIILEDPIWHEDFRQLARECSRFLAAGSEAFYEGSSSAPIMSHARPVLF
ncbi:unnamed protein product, partial [Effrenium voratum]